MPATRLAPIEATTFQLLGELEAYELHLHEVARQWGQTGDVVLFGEAGRSLDRIRGLASALPAVSALWVMVMVSHAELMHDLWRVSNGERLDMACEVQGHLAYVRELATACRQLLLRTA